MPRPSADLAFGHLDNTWLVFSQCPVELRIFCQLHLGRDFGQQGFGPHNSDFSINDRRTCSQAAQHTAQVNYVFLVRIQLQDRARLVDRRLRERNVCDSKKRHEKTGHNDPEPTVNGADQGLEIDRHIVRVTAAKRRILRGNFKTESLSQFTTPIRI